MSQISSLASPLFGASKDTADFLLRIIAAAGFALLTAIAARASFDVPGSSVPMTLQTLSVTASALALGPRLGMASMLIYLAAAAAGAPVLAGGDGGWREVIGPTGGYLIGFVLAQPVIAKTARRGGEVPAASDLITALVLGNLVILGCGAAWLVFMHRMLPAGALNEGVWPFLPGAVIKSAAAFVLGFALVPLGVKRGW